MAYSPFLPARGLRTNESPELSQGALESALNLVCRRIGVLEPRMGFRAGPDSGLDAISLLFHHAGFVFAIADNSGTEDLIRYNPDTGAIADLGAAVRPGMEGATRQCGVSVSGSLIVSTSVGQKKVDTTAASALSSAGMPAGLDAVATLNAAGPGFLPVDAQVAYRNMWVRATGNTPSRYVYGAPSGRSIVVNPAAGVAGDRVNLTIPIPAGITVNDWLHLSRTLVSADDAADPGEDYRLCVQAQPAAADIANGYMVVNDVRPEALLGEAAYYATSVLGPAEANETPPIAGAMAVFKECLFAGNVKGKHRLLLSMIVDPASAAGVQIADTITIAGVVFTAGAAENLATRTFLRVAGGTASQNIAGTVRSLVNVINRGTGSTASYARYLSGPDDMPGIFLVEERTIGGSAFTAVASARGAAYEPPLPVTGTTISSDNNTRTNGIVCTPQGEPEHWPLPNEWFAGSVNTVNLLALVPLREAMIIVTTRGAYRLVGNTPDDFEVLLVDPDLKSASPYSWVEVDNKAVGATERGIVAIGETGAVEDLPRPLGQIISDACGVAVSTHKEYLAFQGTFEVGWTVGYRYNFRTKQWTDIGAARALTGGVEVIKSGNGYLVFGTESLTGLGGFCKEEHAGDPTVISTVKDSFLAGETAAVFTQQHAYTPLKAGAPGVPKKAVEVIISTEPVVGSGALTLSGVGSSAFRHLGGNWTRAVAPIPRAFQRGDSYAPTVSVTGVVKITGIMFSAEATEARGVR